MNKDILHPLREDDLLPEATMYLVSGMLGPDEPIKPCQTDTCKQNKGICTSNKCNINERDCVTNNCEQNYVIIPFNPNDSVVVDCRVHGRLCPRYAE